MTMFGIVSDVIAGIGLVKDLKDAASDCSRASDEYNSLVSIIRDLEPLLHCPSLQLEEADPKDLQLYHKVVINIDQSAKNFMSKIEQFDKKLSFDSPGFAKRMSVAFRRMEWSSAKSLVEELKTNLILHNTILMGIGQRITLKMENDRLALQKQQQCQPCGAQNRASMHIPHTSSHPDPTIEHEEASHIMRLEPYYDSNEVHNSLAQSTTNIQETRDNHLLAESFVDHSPWFIPSLTNSSSSIHTYSSIEAVQFEKNPPCRALPIKSPIDGSIRIFTRPAASETQSASDDIMPKFVIPGQGKNRLVIKNPCDGSIKSLDIARNSVGKQDTRERTHKIEPIFVRPLKKKVIVKDPSTMGMIHL